MKIYNTNYDINMTIARAVSDLLLGIPIYISIKNNFFEILAIDSISNKTNVDIHLNIKNFLKENKKINIPKENSNKIANEKEFDCYFLCIPLVIVNLILEYNKTEDDIEDKIKNILKTNYFKDVTFIPISPEIDYELVLNSIKIILNHIFSFFKYKNLNISEKNNIYCNNQENQEKSEIFYNFEFFNQIVNNNSYEKSLCLNNININDFSNFTKFLHEISNISEIIPIFIVKYLNNFIDNPKKDIYSSNINILSNEKTLSIGSIGKTHIIIDNIYNTNYTKENDIKNHKDNLINQDFIEDKEKNLTFFTNNLPIELIAATPIELHKSNLETINIDFLVFRHFNKEHYAIIIPPSKSSLNLENNSKENSNIKTIRVHSACFTGDLMCSLHCDCYSQLHSAIDLISNESSGGAVIYLNQEGRGIGLTNKIRAYHMQQKYNLNTVDSNRILGLPDDSRDFYIAAQILNYLKWDEVNILTNNPEKKLDIMKYGIKIKNTHYHISNNSEKLRNYYISKARDLNQKILEKIINFNDE
ncbi:GTP cyclohydrolase II RibA [Lyticum sinuosum]|uniref:Riboflavin biosynthesis protein RibBA n=1 Tax=Lyticum sinuosum TaxID=1332059 RepID=A0AAE5AHH7_9RICK|nr:GTP cyclohydrolase II RibA [Lyticum sinuosum]MDZ5761041.1 Riboflavin biosynthesis protein RibBA [Lyticum sinuosum]